MKIAVNTRLLLKNKLEGIGWFTYETLKRITQDHPEHTFYFIFDRPYDVEFIFAENVIPMVIGPQARHPLLFYAWFEFSIPRVLKRIDADLFLSPDGYISLSTKVPTLAVIHDLNFEHYPKDLPWIITKYYRYFFPRFAKKADRIATVSEFSKHDIHKLYGIPNEKIDVVYDGVNEQYHPVSEAVKSATKKEFSVGCDYFIFIGALLPRKNLKNLFLAFDIFRSTHQADVKLLIVGAEKWWTGEMEQTFNHLEYKNDILFTGRVAAEDLNNLLGSALGLTYVSYFEGFGIPILEAFHCDTPVITSNVSSMPEVAGDAALLCDPFNPEHIAAAMGKIAKDANCREALIAKAKVRRNLFSWNRTAALLWESMEKTAKK